MTHSVGRQSGAPFVSGPGATNNVTTSFNGGPWTYIRTHVDSSAETLATWRLDEDTSSKGEFVNGSNTNAAFIFQLRGTNSGTGTALQLSARLTTDTGTAEGWLLDTRTVAGAAVTTRPLGGIANFGTTVLSFLPLNSGANMAMSWGTQSGAAPAFTTRSAGTRLVLAAAIDGTHVDHAIGINSSTILWQSIPVASSSYAFQWYGGTTQLMALRGDGVLNVGSTTNSSRGGQKIETSASGSNAGVASSTWSADATGCIIDLNKSRSSTIGTQSVVSSGDDIGRVVFRGSDGTNFIPAAEIFAEVDGTPGTNDMPGRLTFSTTADGAAAVTERMRITNAGDVGVGKTPTTGIILDVNGQLGLKSYTVATLPSASVQAGAIVYASDAGGNGPCLVISNGTNWKRCDNTSTTVS